jgi:predicted nucleic acid-binding protein
MNFVLDSSFALTWVFADEARPVTDEVLDSMGRGATAFVPALWWWEVGNALLVSERRKRITQAESRQHLMLLTALPIEVDESAREEAWSSCYLLARNHHLTLYDAAYLEVALRRGLPLASIDHDLREAAKAEGVALLPTKR